MKLLRWKLLLIAAAGFAFSGTANAQNTQNIAVSATVPDFCIFDVATSETTMAFDLTNVGVATLDFEATTDLAWRCSNGFDTVITIGPGVSGNQEARTMTFGGLSLAYNLYTEDTHTNIWGDGTGNTVTAAISGTGMGNVGNTTVYGRVLLTDAQAAAPGTYSDSVLVTIVL